MPIITALLLITSTGLTPYQFGSKDILRVGGEVSEPTPLSQPSPDYPAEARKELVEGTVILEAIITPEGGVASLRILSSVDPLVDEASATAVRQWRYKPARYKGRPVPVYLTVTCKFALPPVLTKPRSPDSFLGTWRLGSDRVWVGIAADNSIYQCRVLHGQPTQATDGLLEGVHLTWSNGWGPDVIRRQGLNLILDGREGLREFRPVDEHLASSCWHPWPKP